MADPLQDIENRLRNVEETLRLIRRELAIMWKVGSGVAGAMVLVLVAVVNSLINLSGAIGELRGESRATSTQVLELRSDLPDLRLTSAEAQLARQLHAAVVATYPVQVNSTWHSTVFLFVPPDSTLETFSVNLDAAEDKTAAHLARGLCAAWSPDNIGFDRLRSLAAAVGKHVEIPSYVLVDGSCVVHLRSEQRSPTIPPISPLMQREGKPVKEDWVSRLSTWEALAKELTTNPSRYTAPRTSHSR